MGQVSSGISNSGSYAIKAGFQHMQGVSIAVSSPADTVLAPDIPGISGGTADGNVAWNVETDSYSGFDMKINSSTTPAMKLPPDGTYYFDDYSTTPTYNWSIGANSAKFGYTVVPATPADAVLAFKDDSIICGAGSSVGSCWSGLTSSTVAIVHRQSRTSSSGESELVNFKAQSNKLLKDGSYVASITVTVSSN